MAQENVEVVRRGYEALLGGQLDEALSLLADDVRWDGVAGVEPCRGRPEVEANIRRSLGTGARFDIEEIIPAGDRVVVGLRPRGPSEDQRADMPDPYRGADRLYNVVTVLDGKMVHLRDHLSRADALQSADRAD